MWIWVALSVLGFLVIAFIATFFIDRLERRMIFAKLDQQDLSIPDKLEQKNTGHYLPFKNAKRVIVWFPGNGYTGIECLTVQSIANQFFAMQRLWEADIFFLNYRCREPFPHERAVYQIAKEAISALRAQEALGKDIILLGHSLGCAVAAEIAPQISCRAILLFSPVASIKRIALRINASFRWLYYVCFWLPINRYDTENKMLSLAVPVHIIHGENDELTPLSLAKQMYEAASAPKYLHVVDGANHYNLDIVGFLLAHRNLVP